MYRGVRNVPVLAASETTPQLSTGTPSRARSFPHHEHRQHRPEQRTTNAKLDSMRVDIVAEVLEAKRRVSVYD